MNKKNICSSCRSNESSTNLIRILTGGRTQRWVCVSCLQTSMRALNGQQPSEKLQPD